MISYQPFNGILRILTGCRIGGSKDTIGIAETDLPCIRDPFTNLPYVPGSSIKGKLRWLLEVNRKKFTPKGLPCDCAECEICILFGCGYPPKSKGTTRLLFRDCFLTDQSKEKLLALESTANVEEKSEVSIHRPKGTVAVGPWTGERIPAGAEFDFTFTLREIDDAYSIKDPKELYKTLAEGFQLLDKDHLGSSGSRGYGMVQLLHESGIPMHEHLRKLAEGAGKAAGR